MSDDKTFEQTWRAVVDGSARGPVATALRAFARLASVPYSLVVRARNFAFDVGLKRSFALGRPTVAVGNLTVGGVGKTPFVAWLTEYFLDAGLRPAIISRGYRAERQREIFAEIDGDRRAVSVANVQTSQPPVVASGPQNDEARELASLFPTVPHFQGPNRVEVAKSLLAARPDVDAITLDDAFQHRRARRDLNVVLLDALNPFGGGRLLPAGLLREPLSSLRRADVVLLNRADLVSADRRAEIRTRVESLAPTALFAEIAQVPRFVRTADSRDFADLLDFDERSATANVFPIVETTANERPNVSASVLPLCVERRSDAESSGNSFADGSLSFEPPTFASGKETFANEAANGPASVVPFDRWRATARNRRYVAFCGLGAPDGFRRTLTRSGIETTAFVEFPDHCAYGPAELSRLSELIESTGADGALTTAKDWVKLTTARPGGRPIFAMGIGVEFLTGESEFRVLLARRFPNAEPANPERRAERILKVEPTEILKTANVRANFATP